MFFSIMGAYMALTFELTRSGISFAFGLSWVLSVTSCPFLPCFIMSDGSIKHVCSGLNSFMFRH